MDLPGAGSTRLWVMADRARSWSLDALLHLSYESLLAFSDREAWEREGLGKVEVILLLNHYNYYNCYHNHWL